jgi:hypothetical protein
MNGDRGLVYYLLLILEPTTKKFALLSNFAKFLIMSVGKFLTNMRNFLKNKNTLLINSLLSLNLVVFEYLK